MESGRSVLEGSRNDAFVDRCCSWVRPGNQSGPRTIRADQPGREGGGHQSGHQEGVGRVTAEAGRLTEYSAQARADEADQRGDYDSEIGRAHVLTPVTNAHLVCRLLLE